MAYRVEVTPREGSLVEAAAAVARRLGEAGVGGIARVEVVRLFFLDGALWPAEQALLTEAMADPVVDDAAWMDAAARRPAPAGARVVEVSPRPGVTDSVAETLHGAAAALGITDLTHVATGTRYVVHGVGGPPDAAALARAAGAVLANAVVQQFVVDGCVPPPFAPTAEASGRVERVALRDADDDRLLAISAERRLSLDLTEMRAIRAEYRRLKREPSDLELEMLAQTWSEHCVHKTFRARIALEVRSADGVARERRVVDGMLRACLRAATEKVAKPWVRSAFVDNAGIVAFDEEFDLALKVETHNHPSALEPFGGANTGVGGVVRDILGVSARPIANIDVLCFGPLDTDPASLPEGVLHPRRVAEGVVHGVEDYGNKMGIPTVAGAIRYDRGYIKNPLVFCGCVGILPRGSHRTQPRAGDAVVVLGGRTGRDGLRGATFSSMEMSHETGAIAGSSVQIGHPINEKQVQEVVVAARDAGLYTAITDCGAGGLSSAVGEMAATLGADVELSTVPLKYPGLQPWEIWLSEAQERMVLAVPPDRLDALRALCATHAVEATVIGRFRDDGLLRVCHRGAVVGELRGAFLHDGIPRREMEAVWQPPKVDAAPIAVSDPATALRALLASPDGASKADVVRRYDHEVQGGTVVRPLVGVAGDGPGDAAVLVPLAARQRGRLTRGVALGCGINPDYGRLDPYRMAWAAVDEAVRNVVAVGGDPDHLSLIDNFCWGNPRLPDRLGSLVRCAEGCHDAALAFGAPYISGKDSLNNEYADAEGRRHAIPGTILITAMAIVPDTARVATSAFERAGNRVLLVGDTRAELGGSALAKWLGRDGGEVPAPVADGLARARAVHRCIASGRVAACHDLSEGGLLVAVAEMCIGGRIGATVDVGELPGEGLPGEGLDRTARLFAESSSRWLLEVAPDAIDAIAECLDGIPWVDLGAVGGAFLAVRDGGAKVLELPVDALVAAFG